MIKIMIIIVIIIIKLMTVTILLNWPPSNSCLMSVWGSACKPLKMSQLMFPLLRITLLKKGAIINKNRLHQLTWWCNYHYVIGFSLTFTYFNIIIILFWALYLSMHCEASFFFFFSLMISCWRNWWQFPIAVYSKLYFLPQKEGQ